MKNSIGFIGGGRITAIFLAAWKAAGIDLSRITVSDTAPEVLGRLHSVHPGIETTPDNRRVWGQDIIFLALHPPVMKAVLPEAGPSLRESATVVSLAPVLSFSAMKALLNGHGRLVRMIPNAPSLLGRGYNPIVWGPESMKEDQERLSPLFAALGASPVVPENQLEAHAILTAMGPTYFWPQWQVLRELGQAFGLDPETTDRGLAAMLHGAVAQLLESGHDFESVMDTVPVKPLAESQPAILAPFREKLPVLHARLTGRQERHP